MTGSHCHLFAVVQAAAWRSLLLALCTALLAACGTSAPPTHFDSLASYNRAFDTALSAMADHRLVFSVEDRRGGRIVGEIGGETITATLSQLPSGVLRVNFVPQNDTPAGLALQRRVADSYMARASGQSLLGGSKESDNYRGPVPCPSGPAFCR